MNECVFCRDRLIRHLKHRRAYWFCSSCYQEMPNIKEVKTNSEAKISRRLINLVKNPSP